MMPVAGSAYSFTSATLGSFLGFVIGWDLVLEYMMGAGACVRGEEAREPRRRHVGGGRGDVARTCRLGTVIPPARRHSDTVH